MKPKIESRPFMPEASAAPDVLRGTATGFTPLAIETRTVINTNEAAFHLGRTPQTLRRWACYGEGGLRPIRIRKRLFWKVADLKKIVTEGSDE